MKKMLFILLIFITINAYGFGRVSKNNQAVKAINDTLLYNAEEELKEILEKDPDNPIINYNYGLTKLKQFEEYRNESALAESIESFEKAKADTSRTNLQALYYNQANAYYNLKDYASAVNNYQESATYLDSTSVDLDLVYNLANSIYKFAEENPEYDSLLTRVDEMYKSIVSGVDQQHKQKILHNLGNSAFKQSKYQDAINYYVESLRLNPKSETTRINYEIALRKLSEQQSSQEKQENQDKKKSDQEHEGSSKQDQEQEQQQQEAKEKQEEYDDLSKEEKEKLEAEKKLDALLQEQSRDDDNEDKTKFRQNRPSGKYW